MAILATARNALEAAADKILHDYRTWVADNSEAKPRYGQIPVYDSVNAAIGDIDAFLLTTTAMLDKTALRAECLRLFKDNKMESDERLAIIIADYFAPTLSHAAGDVAPVVDKLTAWAQPDTGAKDYGAQLVCAEAATTLLALSARAEAAEAREAKGAVADIAAERRRQMEAEGWSPEHDDKHDKGELAGAAACYAMNDLNIHNIALGHRIVMIVRDLWPWALSWWKPTDHRRNLVKAGALIVAEIERLDRLAARSLSPIKGAGNNG